MALSVFDLFKIGIGPSSSHTVGPMRAAFRFVRKLRTTERLTETQRVRVELYGSLALTGRGHATDKAVLLGLSGESPEDVDPEAVEPIVEGVRSEKKLLLDGNQEISFDESKDLLFLGDQTLPRHPNGMRFIASAADDKVLASEDYYSVGGGFVVDEAEAEAGCVGANEPPSPVPFEFASAAELLELAAKNDLTIAGLVRRNELAWRPDAETDAGLDGIWSAMKASIERGCRSEGVLPGGLEVRRRAVGLYLQLANEPASDGWFDRSLHPMSVGVDPLHVLDWVSLFALAVNEENAAGGRVVTAPTNGAAGVIPATIAYAARFLGIDDGGVREFLLTAGAIGSLYKRNASLSAAEMGCQGEVGVACSMAAGGLAAVMGGSSAQVENAAEIGMEHNLGLTCDPIAGLVQVPCIERNAMGAVKAINAARLALHGDGSHRVSLDKVIETMRQTGRDMQAKYKETSLGGLAVNVSVNIVDC